MHIYRLSADPAVVGTRENRESRASGSNRIASDSTLSFHFIAAPAVVLHTNRQILPSPLSQLIPESSSMAGGSPDPQGNKYTHNDAAFAEYNTRLQSSNLPTFTSAVSKLTEWLGSDKAYYSNARAPVRLPSRPPRRILLIIVDLFRSFPLSRYADSMITPSPSPNSITIKSAHANICRVQGDLTVPFKLDRALPGLDPWYRPYLSLLEQAGTHLNYFEPELRGNPLLIHLTVSLTLRTTQHVCDYWLRMRG